MKTRAATSNDHINIEALKAGEDTISKARGKLYIKCLSERRISIAWKNAKIVVIFKKGNKKDLKNYRPICLLSNICKPLTKILTKMLEKTLDENQPREQTGFRSGYSTTDNIHVVNQLKEKRREYNILLCIAFVSYGKACSAHSSRTDLVSRTGGRRWVHRTPEGLLHKQLDDNPLTRRKQREKTKFATFAFSIGDDYNVSFISFVNF